LGGGSYDGFNSLAGAAAVAYRYSTSMAVRRITWTVATRRMPTGCRRCTWRRLAVDDRTSGRARSTISSSSTRRIRSRHGPNSPSRAADGTPSVSARRRHSPVRIARRFNIYLLWFRIEGLSGPNLAGGVPVARAPPPPPLNSALVSGPESHRVNYALQYITGQFSV